MCAIKRDTKMECERTKANRGAQWQMNIENFMFCLYAIVIYTKAMLRCDISRCLGSRVGAVFFSYSRCYAKSLIHVISFQPQQMLCSQNRIKRKFQFSLAGFLLWCVGSWVCLCVGECVRACVYERKIPCSESSQNMIK